MEIITDFNPVTSRVNVTVRSNLLSRYFSNFRGMVLESKILPPETSIIQKSVDSAQVSFSTTPTSFNGGNRWINNATKVLSKFVQVAVSKELNTIGFFPLSGYSPDKMQEEIQDNVKNKRDILLIKDYKEYLDMDVRSPKFIQYRLEYGTPEYADVALMLWKKQISKLKKDYSPKLQFTKWT